MLLFAALATIATIATVAAGGGTGGTANITSFATLATRTPPSSTPTATGTSHVYRPHTVSSTYSHRSSATLSTTATNTIDTDTATSLGTTDIEFQVRKMNETRRPAAAAHVPDAAETDLRNIPETIFKECITNNMIQSTIPTECLMDYSAMMGSGSKFTDLQVIANIGGMVFADCVCGAKELRNVVELAPAATEKAAAVKSSLNGASDLSVLATLDSACKFDGGERVYVDIWKATEFSVKRGTEVFTPQVPEGWNVTAPVICDSMKKYATSKISSSAKAIIPALWLCLGFLIS
ncbi:hypothetical protein BDR26DRAFT_921154, partial [Obelidium mucronatum]